MKVLVIDIGGSNVKILANGQTERRRMPSGPTLTPSVMVEGVKALAQGWDYDVLAIGYPGVVRHDQAVTEPHNLAGGWVGFDFATAFGKPVKMINDAAMQALGSYEREKMLFLGLGTGLGSALVVRGLVLPMELAHLPYRGRTFEHHVGARALQRLGRKKWRERVVDVAQRLAAALVPDELVFGGGNAKLLSELPAGCRAVGNANAFVGGFRLWDGSAPATASGPGAKTSKRNQRPSP
jgi:predicted NBD/HSP70 family sugar kinase